MLRPQQDIYTFIIVSDEKLLSYINQAQHFGQILKSMDFNVDGKKTAMGVLIGLST